MLLWFSLEEKYTVQQVTTYFGESAVPLGFTNNSFICATKNQHKEGMGRKFTAFVIPEKMPDICQKGEIERWGLFIPLVS
ncbi:hypothetical protein [Virgibacillus oceani]|uniref:Uncharacterized protein n=1 Tax=Virgibacillus oceani TaxID=1479511 RepID=A0A917LVM1_9BACI|nr:hypothetical protein [Virgibacillus oceani]GGG61265.1 hypothetical protein GCM10011398_00680 [Virgibacillus oceani]